MTKTKKVETPKLYVVAIHKPHPSGIGSIFLRYEHTETKPSLDIEGYFYDITNSEWARYEQ